MENGDIEIGDPLTSASKPGYAMKATKPGMILGHAMEAFASSTTSTAVYSDGGFDMINMVVQTGYYFGSDDTPLGQIAGFLGETTTTQIVQQAFDGDAYAISQIAGGMVNPQVADGSALNGVSSAQLDILIVRTAVLIAGDLTVGGDSKLLGHIIVSNETAGVVDLPAGENYVEIQFATPFENIPVVVVTPESDADEYFAPWLGKFRIAKKTINGFRIEVDEGACIDPTNCGRTMRFNWIAVGVIQGEDSTSTSTIITTTSTSPIVEEVVIEQPTDNDGTVQVVDIGDGQDTLPVNEPVPEEIIPDGVNQGGGVTTTEPIVVEVPEVIPEAVTEPVSEPIVIVPEVPIE